MLTLKQISEISFRKSSFSGYKPEDVDNFIDEVTESFTALLKENQANKAKVSELNAKNGEYKEKLVLLAQKVEQYKKDEEGIKDALLTAQKLGNQSIRDAKKKAEKIIADAKSEAEYILSDANNEQKKMVVDYESQIEAKKKELESLKAVVTDFRTNLYGMYRDHLKLIEKLPDYTDELKKAEEEKKAAQVAVAAQPAPVAEPVKETAPVEEVQPQEDDFEILSEDELPQEDLPDLSETGSFTLEDTSDDFSVDGIDLNAYADIPESLKKEKESLYSTLEFGDGIHL